MSIGQRISNLRKDNGYSQEYVAEKLDVSRQAVSKWETDTSAPDTYNLIALAELFDVSVEYIAVGKQTVHDTNNSEDVTHSRINTQERIGFVLFGLGLIAIVLGLLFSDVVIFIGVGLILAGTVCIPIPKKRGLIVMWGGFVVIFIGVKLLSLYFFFRLQQNINDFENGIRLITLSASVSWICAAVCIAVSIITVVKFKLNERQTKVG